MLYLTIYNTTIKKLIEMDNKNEIQLTETTKEKLKDLYKQTNCKFRYLLPFIKYNFETMKTETDKTTNELTKILFVYGNKNLRYGFKIKQEV